ncbi:GPR endopeptidase [Lachnospiraceae bacterium DSM 108991]|uniref:Germination protease n=1 Tax=Claveliimonas monacensis TaxID=2779351 RepID=A0ABR9RFZ7_9FIRM|nr:GPR endopeptidase [Claveliimonas monacensis]MBE5061891.1 GPR endopeptidase [Claveliimonas monacensis]
MIEKYSIRTDLALEQKERFEADNVEIPGVVLEENNDEGRNIKVTTVRIETENGAKIMGKPVGTYITLEAPELTVPDEGYHREVSAEILQFLRQLLDIGKEDFSVLVAGLGNRQVTPDALGPYVADNLNITRHIVKEYGKYAMGKDRVCLLSAIVPGVMGQTGMETVEIIRGVVEETRPDALIAIDALAARNSKRLNRTVQITDTGISPGSGVGNQRNAITEETVGVPVIAIGVPTVVDAATIVNDAMENLIAQMEQSEALKGVGVVLQGYNGAEKYELVKELIAPHLNGMFVTPKDVDETVKRISYTISEALNQLCCS